MVIGGGFRPRSIVGARGLAVLVSICGVLHGCGDGPAEPKDAMVPELNAISPSALVTGSAPNALSLEGKHFEPSSRARINGADRPTTWQGPTKLVTQLSGADLANPGTLLVSVFTPPPGGGTSNTLSLVVDPRPLSILALEPAGATVGSDGMTLAVIGEGFGAEAVVRWAGFDRSTRWVSSQRLETTLTGMDLAVAGLFPVTVRDPRDGTTTVERAFTVWNPTPSVEGVSPASVLAGRLAFRLSIAGADFVQGAQVLWNGASRLTTLVTPTLLEVEVAAADVSHAGMVTIGVRNPPPTRSASDPVTLEVGMPERRVIPVETGGIAWDPLRERLYVSVRASDPTNPNEVIALDPTTGETLQSVPVGSDPGRLAISDDASVLYVALDGAAAIRRIDLSTFTPGPPFPVGTVGPDIVWAYDLEVAPGSPGTVAATYKLRFCNELGCWYGLAEGVAVYDDGVRRGPFAGGGSVIAFAGPDVLYAYNGVTTGHELYRMTLSDTGAVVDEEAHLGGLMYGFYADIAYMNGRLFSSQGPVVDVQREVRVGDVSVGGTVAADPTTGRVFYMWDNTLSAVDAVTLELLGSEEIQGVPPLDQPVYLEPALIRWGPEGFAYRTPLGVVIFRSGLASR